MELQVRSCLGRLVAPAESAAGTSRWCRVTANPALESSEIGSEIGSSSVASGERTLAQATKPPSASDRRQDHTMKINDTANRRQLNHLGLGLTEAEAQ
ncbi:MAG TPA: hypothetical protein VEW11_05840, partial [Gaiellaceae bacterium]|nr:hypothetical protein [Gaiellaceae bacterium]